MPATLADWTDRTRDGLDLAGTVRLKDVIPADWLAAAQAEAMGYVATKGAGDHDLIEPSEWNCPVIERFAIDEHVKAFLDSLVVSRPASGLGGYNRRVLRILDGTSGVHALPFRWHYDGSAVTMIIPIVVPDDGSGQLAIFPNSRPHRPSALISVGEKIVADNWLYGRWLKRRFDKRPGDHTVPLVPGNAYVFRGYRSLHGTLPWPEGSLRVTLVLQYGYPYGPEGGILRAARSCRDAARRVLGGDRPFRYPAT